MAASEEELLLIGLFGEDAERLLRAIRGRASADDDDLATVDKARAERIREIVAHRPGVEHRRADDRGGRPPRLGPLDARRARPLLSDAPLALPEPAAQRLAGPSNGFVSVESPMVGTFYRAPAPGSPPFVEVGDVVAAGQTLGILEAMKLMNEVKSDLEAVVRAIHVGNAQPVEFGQALFDLEPLAGRPLDAASASARAGHWLRSCPNDVARGSEPRRDRRARDPRAARARNRGGHRLLDRRRRCAARTTRRPRREDRAAAGGAELPLDTGDRGGCGDDRLRGGASRVRLPLRERGLRARVRGQRPRVHRAARGRDGADGRQGAGEGGDARRGRPARARQRRHRDSRRGPPSPQTSSGTRCC